MKQEVNQVRNHLTLHGDVFYKDYLHLVDLVNEKFVK